MAILNPCCCISLQKGSKTIAYLDIILASIPILVFLSTYLPGSFGPDGRPFSDFNTGIWTILIVFVTADIGLSILLLYAAKTRCVKKVKGWFYIRLVTVGLMVLLIIVTACFEVSIHLIIYDLFYTVYRLYSLWVVYLFIGELVHEQIFFSNTKKPDFSSTTVTISVVGQTNKEQLNNSNPPDYLNGNKYGAVNNAYVTYE